MFDIVSNSNEVRPQSFIMSRKFINILPCRAQSFPACYGSTSHYEASNSVRTVKDVSLKIKATFEVAVQRQSRKSHLCPVLFIFPIHIQAVSPTFFYSSFSNLNLLSNSFQLQGYTFIHTLNIDLNFPKPLC